MRKHQNFVTLDDGVDTMSDGDDCTAYKLLLDHLLNFLFGHDINVCSGFVKDHNLVFG